MNIENQIRSLAKSPYWQEIYRSSKSLGGINLFENSTSISGLQYLFLYWLKIYDLLYTELAGNNWSNLSLEVINDDIRTSAFLYWRRKEIEKENRKQKKQNKSSGLKKGSQNFNIYKGQGNK